VAAEAVLILPSCREPQCWHGPARTRKVPGLARPGRERGRLRSRSRSHPPPGTCGWCGHPLAARRGAGHPVLAFLGTTAALASARARVTAARRSAISTGAAIPYSRDSKPARGPTDAFARPSAGISGPGRWPALARCPALRHLPAARGVARGRHHPPSRSHSPRQARPTPRAFFAVGVSARASIYSSQNSFSEAVIHRRFAFPQCMTVVLAGSRVGSCTSNGSR
jgi:hypothetical protein